MNIYKTVPAYSKTTGQYSHDEIVFDHIICDYCGKEISDEDEEWGGNAAGYEVSYIIRENGGCEPMYDQHDLWVNTIGLPGDKYIRSYEIFGRDHSEFFYCRNWDGLPNCEALMIKEYLKNAKNDNWSVYDIMYETRLQMLIKVINSKQYSLKDFKLEIV